MPVDREARRLECCTVVALLASIAPWLTGELAFMFVAVAVDAGCELNLEFRCGTGWYVASGAIYICMRKVEREAGLRMVSNRERRGAPALHGMAAFAPAAIWTFRKLATVRIGFVAVGTFAVRNWSLKVPAHVTAQTLDLGMFPKKRKISLRVIEVLCEMRSLP
jgi:hypothetical protein